MTINGCDLFVRLASYLKFYDGISDRQSEFYDNYHHLNQSTRLLDVLISKPITVMEVE